MNGKARSTYWSDPAGIHFVLGQAAVPAGVWDLIKSAASDAELRPARARHRRPEYREFLPAGGSRTFGVSAAAKGLVGAEVAIFPAFDSATDTNEADVLAAFASHLCTHLKPQIARSFDVGGGNGSVGPDELQGPLQWIDWWQYLGVAFVERTGRSRLLGLTAFEVKDGPHGGLFLRITRLPNEGFSQRAFAAALGIRLKPMREWHPETQSWSEREWPL